MRSRQGSVVLDRSGPWESTDVADMKQNLRVLFGICYRRRYLSMGQYEHVSRLLNETGRMAGGWEKSSETKRKPV